jgi:hypothetical protein
VLSPKEILELEALQRLQDNRRRVFKDAYLIGFETWSDQQELETINSVRGANLGVSLDELRDLISYLEGLGLLRVNRLALRWDYQITALGVQAYEGDAPWPLGVSPK